MLDGLGSTPASGVLGQTKDILLPVPLKYLCLVSDTKGLSYCIGPSEVDLGMTRHQTKGYPFTSQLKYLC